MLTGISSRAIKAVTGRTEGNFSMILQTFWAKSMKQLRREFIQEYA